MLDLLYVLLVTNLQNRQSDYSMINIMNDDYSICVVSGKINLLQRDYMINISLFLISVRCVNLISHHIKEMVQKREW